MILVKNDDTVSINNKEYTSVEVIKKNGKVFIKGYSDDRDIVYPVNFTKLVYSDGSVLGITSVTGLKQYLEIE